MTPEPDYQLIPSFLAESESLALFQHLEGKVDWDESMKARKTACYGESYDESGVDFKSRALLPELEALCDALDRTVGFRPTNCLLNFYEDGRSTMGFHSDTIANLAEGTGIVIVSLGAERELTFRHKNNYEIRHRYLLPNGSLFYMTQATQESWTHAVKRSDVAGARISLTFRRILSKNRS